MRIFLPYLHLFHGMYLSVYVSYHLHAAIQDVAKDLRPSIKLFKYTRRPLNTSGDGVKVAESSNDFTAMLESTPPSPWHLTEGNDFNGKMLYIYTSGTTGLPKAAVISSSR